MSLALLVGDRHAGKTAACRRLVELARPCAFSVGGIIAPAIYDTAGSCVGYDVVDLATGRSSRLATIAGPGVEQVGCFHFLPEGLALGRAALKRAAELPDQLVIVDEVGSLELAGGGWAEQLDQLAHRRGLTLFAVRRALAKQVAERWNVSPLPLEGVEHPTPQSIYDLAQGSDAVIAAILRSLEA